MQFPTDLPDPERDHPTDKAMFLNEACQVYFLRLEIIQEDELTVRCLVLKRSERLNSHVQTFPEDVLVAVQNKKPRKRRRVVGKKVLNKAAVERPDSTLVKSETCWILGSEV